jgi:cell division protein FtsN
MRLPLPISLSLLLLALAQVHAQPLVDADEFFHGGAQLYLSNNVPAALGVVTNGLAQFPDDAKLKKLEELLKQKQQEQQQQDQQKQDQEKKDQQKSEQDKKDQQKKDEPDKQDKKDDPKKPQPSKPEKKDSADKKDGKPKPGQMTPAQAARLLDGQKGEEEALVFKPEGKPKDESKPVKDW